MGGFPFRPALLAAAVVFLLAVVAAASRSEESSLPGDAHRRSLPDAFWDYLVTFAVIGALLVLVLVMTMKIPLPRRQSSSLGLAQVLGTIAVVGLVVIAAQRANLPDLRPGDEGLADTEVTARPSEAKPADQLERDRGIELQWPLVFAAGVLTLLGAGAYYLRRGVERRRLSMTGPAAALSLALDESVEDLRAERDARRAVIAAYARMERALERQGLGRRAHEAPLEYLARVLRELHVRSSSVLALTELFERAKFSRHEIDAEMKDEAIGALVAVRDDLRARTA
jgi:Domain of unknown function (DUF4129)